MRRVLPHTDSLPASCTENPKFVDVKKKKRKKNNQKKKNPTQNQTKHAHTEQRCEARGRRLGEREGTKRSSSGTAGLTHCAALRSVGSPAVPSWERGSCPGPGCSAARRDPREHGHAQHCGALSIRGEAQAAACLLLLSAQKNRKCSGSPASRPGATSPAHGRPGASLCTAARRDPTSLL